MIKFNLTLTLEILQTISAIVGAGALWFAYKSIKQTEQNLKIAQRTNELTVLPNILATIPVELNETGVEKIKVENFTDKPAINVRVLFFDNTKKRFFFANNQGNGEDFGYELLLSSEQIAKLSEKSLQFDSKQSLEEKLSSIYGDKVKPLLKNIQDTNYGKSSIYVFFEDLNGDIRLVLRDVEIKPNSSKNPQHRNYKYDYLHSYRRVEK